MKIYFCASAYLDDFERARKIYREIEDLGYKHTSKLVVTINPKTFHENTDPKGWQKIYDEQLKAITEADLCILEISVPSLGLGQYIQEAIRREKPIILMYFRGVKPLLSSGVAGREIRVQLVEYDRESIKEVLADSIEIAKSQLETRFTMLLPPDLVKYLDEINKKVGISKSVYIRQLIRKDMKKIK